MPLLAVQVEKLRCIGYADVPLDPRLTVITGPNASGKTSLLEGIFFLGRGRSFRTRQVDRLIQGGADALTLIGHVAAPNRPLIIGIQASRAGTEARIGGSPVSNLAQLAKALPVQVIEPGVHKLIEEGPASRRRAVDWGVFHVEQDFALQWQKYQRALKQRNAALRSKQPPASIHAWDPELIAAGQTLTSARVRYVSQLQPILQRLAQRLIGIDVTVAFYQGWSADESMADSLQRSWERDVQAGTTTVGPHRADLRIRAESSLARERVSRGQQKLIASALVIAQLELLKQSSGTAGTLLLDDPAAELDRTRLERLLSEAIQLGAQIIATGTASTIPGLENAGSRFHVEQGKVARML